MAVAMSACLLVYVSVAVDYVGPDFVTRMGSVGGCSQARGRVLL